jgi:hypothetical protein
MSRIVLGALALAAWLAFSGVVAAQQDSPAAKKLAGAWAGTLKINDQTSLRLALRVEGAKAVIDSLDQGVKDIEVNTLSYDKGKVRLESQPIQATFEGQLDEKKGEITGTWTQPAGSWPLRLSRAKPGDLTVASPAAPKELEGRWTGTLKVDEETAFRLVLRVEKTDGTLKAVVDSLDQNVSGIPVTAISLEKGQLSFENKGIQATFKGQLDEKKGEITGTWTQPAGSWPLTLAKQK